MESVQLTQACNEGRHGIGQMARNNACLGGVVIHDPVQFIGNQATIELFRWLPVDIERCRITTSNVCYTWTGRH